MRKKKVLHIDDDDRTLKLVARFLHDAGFTVLSSSSPFIAPIIKKERPDVLVMDVVMPLLSGDKIVSIIRGNDFYSLPIIYFSEKPENELEALAAKVHNATYLHKSRGLPALAGKIASIFSH